MAKTPEKNSKSKKNEPAGQAKSRRKGKAPEPQPRIQLDARSEDRHPRHRAHRPGRPDPAQHDLQPAGRSAPAMDRFSARHLRRWASSSCPIVLLLLGLWLVLRKFEKTPRLTREQIAGLIVLVRGRPHLDGVHRSGRRRLDRHGAARRLDRRAGRRGSVVLLAVGWLIAIVLLFDVTPSEIATRIARGLRRIKPTASQPKSTGTDWSSTTTPPAIQPGQPIDVVINTGRSNGNGGKARPARSEGAGPRRSCACAA